MGGLTPTLSARLEVVFRHLASPVVKKAVPLLGCENALTKVRRMLLRIKAVICDAEERREKDEAVGTWLCDLRGVICDADDVFDELTTRVLQLGADLAVCDSDPLFARELLSFDFSTKISNVGEKLDEIVKRGLGLHFNEVLGVDRNADAVKERNGGVVSGDFVDESCVFGRESDKENLVKQLLHGETTRSDFDVLPVVGMSGLGKTTLARLVFRDKRIESHFRPRLWVSVLEDFDTRKLTKAIIEAATGDKYLLLGLDAMQRNLRIILGAKRFLIILDDVRSESCSEWEKLQIPLISGAIGSKVLLTTSSEMVAKSMGSLSPYHLKGLSFEDCWSLFCLHAFGDGNINADPDLVMIGKELVKRCKGSPLAVKILGSLLHTRKDEYEWRHILKNQIWNFPIMNNVYFRCLWLSYLHLPMHLKQCFMYCSLLPKDIKFGKQLLIRLWMAQGFIVPKRNICMEDVGGEYFADLLWRSFFQYSHFVEDGEAKYIMHEVVHDFACFVSDSECFFMHFADSCDLSKSTLHFSLNSSELEALTLEVFNESQGLRTFSLAGECKLHEWKVPADLFVKLSCLRVLDLSNTSLHVVPESIGHLIHLRYLNLSNTQIEWLPESVSNLYNLQTLDLCDCFQLKEIPKGIINLVNLRHLNLKLHQCRVTGLSSFPSGIGHLTNLQTLSTFVVGSMDECKIKELKDLTDIRGELCITKLDNVVSEDEAKEADLRKKEHICKLELQWNLGTNVEEGIQEKVLNNLQPHANLKELIIRGFGGVMLPSWLGDPAFSNLVALNLSDCSKCPLPPLGQLLSLKHLSLEKVGVKYIREDFCGKGKFACFPSLETLKLESLPQLEEWSGVGETDIPCLEELVLVSCSKLKVLPHTLCALKKLEIWNCFCLKSLPKLPSLKSLVLRCPTHTLFDGLHELTSLLHLEIKNCPELTSLPRNLTNLSSLKDLIISDCKQLNLLVGMKILTLDYLEISGCPQLQSFSEGLPATLQFLSICNCPSLAQWCQTIGVENWCMTTHNFSLCIDGEKVSII